jgi:hypothetical protein
MSGYSETDDYVDVIDWDWTPQMMWDGLDIAQLRGDKQQIADIGLTALSREVSPDFSDSESETYTEIWQSALSLLDYSEDGSTAS